MKPTCRFYISEINLLAYISHENNLSICQNPQKFQRERENKESDDQLIFLLCISSPGCGEGTRTTDQYETRNGDGAENFGKGHSWEARHHDIATTTARGDQGN